MTECPEKDRVDQEIAERKQEERERALKLMEDFGNLVNRVDSRAVVTDLLQGFLRQHRTLQQSIVQAFVAMLIEFADEAEENKARFMDPRNEDTLRFAEGLATHPPTFRFV